MRNGFPEFFKLMDRSSTRQGFIALTDQGVTSFTNFVTGIILARACGKEQLGLYVLGFSLVLLIMGIQDSLISSPFTVYSPRLTGVDFARYLGSTLIHQWALSALAMLGLSVAGLLLSSGFGPQQFAPVLWALVIAITFMLLREYARRVCFARLQMKAALILDSGVCVVQIGGLLLLSHLGVLSARQAYWVIAFACALAGIGWLIWIRKHYSVGLRRSRSDLTRNWSFGKWFIGGSLAYIGAVQSYPWLLAIFHGPGSTGILAACLAIVSLANPFMMGMSNFFSPKMAHAYTQGVAELHRVVVKAAILLAGCMGMFFLVILIFGDQFLILAYGGDYAGNRLTLAVLTLTVFIVALSTPFGYGLRAMDRPDVNFKSNSIQLGVTVTVGVWLVKAYGIPGVAFALLLGSLMGGVVTYVYYIVQMRVPALEEPRVETTQL
ncbi:MAG: lipopolysaccharide biosynthesis protein [Candidatus Methanospirareceae archaeon]